MYQTISSPINYGGLTLKNRIIFAPTSMGLPAGALIERYRQIARGGCAMIIVGDVPVLKRGSGPSLYTRKGFDFYRRLADAVHAEGCRLCAQLHQSDANLKAMLRYLPGILTKKISPDELRTLLNEQVGPYITGLPVRKIQEITESFGEAAVRAVDAGFDMVQIHGDRMCGSFSSSVYNRRTDDYGGSPENRARFAVQAVQAVRRRLPYLPIDYKLAVRLDKPHYGNAGVLREELPVFVSLLEEAGVTSLHVTLANHGSLTDTIPPVRHPDFGAEGCFLPLADAVRRVTRLPVCGVGGLTRPGFIEQQLASKRIDCAAMSRQLIADPNWPRKVASGQADTIRRCMRCNKDCLGGMMAHRGVHCIYDKEEKGMTYAIVYSSRTGNTRQLAEALRDVLPADDCVYFGPPHKNALRAERLFVGFWTNKGTCDADTAAFLARVTKQQVFLFGTAGFGGAPAYFDQILTAARENLPDGTAVCGTYMCQGRMPDTVRARYQAMEDSPLRQAMLENFEAALPHPNADDLARLQTAARLL